MKIKGNEKYMSFTVFSYNATVLLIQPNPTQPNPMDVDTLSRRPVYSRRLCLADCGQTRRRQQNWEQTTRATTTPAEHRATPPEPATCTETVSSLSALGPWAPPPTPPASLESIYRVSLTTDVCEGYGRKLAAFIAPLLATIAAQHKNSPLL